MNQFKTEQPQIYTRHTKSHPYITNEPDSSYGQSYYPKQDQINYPIKEVSESSTADYSEFTSKNFHNFQPKTFTRQIESPYFQEHTSIRSGSFPAASSIQGLGEQQDITSQQPNRPAQSKLFPPNSFLQPNPPNQSQQGTYQAPSLSSNEPQQSFAGGSNQFNPQLQPQFRRTYTPSVLTEQQSNFLGSLPGKTDVNQTIPSDNQLNNFENTNYLNQNITPSIQQFGVKPSQLQAQQNLERAASSNNIKDISPMRQGLQNIQASSKKAVNQNLSMAATNNEGFLKKNGLPIPLEIINFDQDCFPQYTMFLLSEEDNNISTFRERVEKEKNRVENDFQGYKQEIINLIEDLKVQFTQAVDDHYRSFIDKYGRFKQEIIEFKNIKLEIPFNVVQPPSKYDSTNVSNIQLIKELEEMRYKNQLSKVQQYISEIQKENLNRIIQISQDILQQMSSSANFYNSDISLKTLKDLKNNYAQAVSLKFEPLHQFVRSIYSLDDERQHTSPSPTKALENLNQISNVQNVASSLPGIAAQSVSAAQQLAQLQQISIKPVPNAMQKQGNSQLQTNSNIQIFDDTPIKQKTATKQQLDLTKQNLQLYNQPVPLISTQQQSNNFSQSLNKVQQIQPPQTFSTPYPLNQKVTFNSDSQEKAQHFQQPTSQMPHFQIENLDIMTNSNQNLYLDNFSNQDISLQHALTITTDHSDILLCFTAISDDCVATGSKDNTIRLWNTKNGSKQGLLKGHNGSICSLLLVKRNGGQKWLASGSDHGDCSIILWDVNTLKMARKLESHTAAVVSLISVDDNQTIISGSYDKDIIIWNINTGSIIQKLSSHSSSVTALNISKDKSRFVSSGLDNLINIWKINYKNQFQEPSFETCQLERTIKNNVFVCSLNSLYREPDLLVAGTKDGKIKLWNLNTGETERQMTVNLGPVVEVLMIEPTKKGAGNLDFTVLSCSNKDKNLVATRILNGNNELIDVQEKMQIDFGCGIGPKMEFLGNNDHSQLVLINQSSTQKEISLWNLVWG